MTDIIPDLVCIAQNIKPINPTSGEHFTFELFSLDRKPIGWSQCHIAVSKKTWIISELEIFEEYRGNKYEAVLLLNTRDALWALNRFPICVKPKLSSGEALRQAASKELLNSSKKWYEEYGFKEIAGNFNYVCLVP